MLCVDVNVLLHAVNSASPRAAQARSTIEAALAGSEPVGLMPLVALGFLRVSTDARVLPRPLEPTQAQDVISALLSRPHVSIVPPGPGQWSTFRRLHAMQLPRGADVTDVYLAASAIDAGATWISYDRGFARFPGLDWRDPAA